LLQQERDVGIVELLVDTPARPPRLHVGRVEEGGEYPLD
jgi:hypothetical protein